MQDLTADSAEIPLLHHYEEQLSDYKSALAEIRRTLLSMELTEGDELETLTSALDKITFYCGLQLKRLMYVPSSGSDETTASITTAPKGVRLPKIDVPTFNGNLVNWRTFWEQFSVAIYDRPRLSVTKKLVYIRKSLKDGLAMNTIEEVSQSGDQYLSNHLFKGPIRSS